MTPLRILKLVLVVLSPALASFSYGSGSEKQNPCPAHLSEVLKTQLDPLGSFLRRPQVDALNKPATYSSNFMDVVGWWGNEGLDQRSIFLKAIKLGTDPKAQKDFFFKVTDRWEFFKFLRFDSFPQIFEIIFEKRSWILREVEAANGLASLKLELEKFQIQNYADWIEFVSLYVLFVDSVKNPSSKFFESIENNRSKLVDQLAEAFKGPGFIPWFEDSRISRIGRLPLGPRYPTLLQIGSARVELVTPIRTFNLPTVSPRESEPLFFQNPLVRDRLPNHRPFVFLTDSFGFFIRDLGLRNTENFGDLGDPLKFFAHQKTLWTQLFRKKIQLGDPPLARGLVDLGLAVMTLGYNRMPLMGDSPDKIMGPSLSLNAVLGELQNPQFRERVGKWVFEQIRGTFDLRLLPEEKEFIFGSFYSDAEQEKAMERAASVVTEIYLGSFSWGG
jgi:hypothetical protein